MKNPINYSNIKSQSINERPSVYYIKGCFLQTFTIYMTYTYTSETTTKTPLISFAGHRLQSTIHLIKLVFLSTAITFPFPVVHENKNEYIRY